MQIYIQYKYIKYIKYINIEIYKYIVVCISCNAPSNSHHQDLYFFIGDPY